MSESKIIKGLRTLREKKKHTNKLNIQKFLKSDVEESKQLLDKINNLKQEIKILDSILLTLDKTKKAKFKEKIIMDIKKILNSKMEIMELKGKY